MKSLILHFHSLSRYGRSNDLPTLVGVYRNGKSYIDWEKLHGLHIDSWDMCVTEPSGNRRSRIFWNLRFQQHAANWASGIGLAESLSFLCTFAKKNPIIPRPEHQSGQIRFFMFIGDMFGGWVMWFYSVALCCGLLQKPVGFRFFPSIRCEP